MGDFSKGLEYLKQAAVLDPKCPIPYVNAARAYLGMNDIKTARRHVWEKLFTRRVLRSW